MNTTEVVHPFLRRLLVSGLISVSAALLWGKSLRTSHANEGLVGTAKNQRRLFIYPALFWAVIGLVILSAPLWNASALWVPCLVISGIFFFLPAYVWDRGAIEKNRQIAMFRRDGFDHPRDDEAEYLTANFGQNWNWF